MGEILPSELQRWVATASVSSDGNGRSAGSVRKHHTMLHSVFEADDLVLCVGFGDQSGVDQVPGAVAAEPLVAFQTVCHGPNSPGRSRQAIPVRNR
jgi:hypothetical protein